MAENEAPNLLSVDDFYFSALSEEYSNELLPVSDSRYAEQLQLQEAIMSALIAYPMVPLKKPKVEKEYEVDIKPKLEKDLISNQTVGGPSQTFCDICMEKKENNKMFRNPICFHSFCTDCTSKHVAAKIQENITKVTCPGLKCKGVLELDSCRSIVPENVVARWEVALNESLFVEAEKYYCPYKDCSVMLVKDDGDEVKMQELECPYCRRLFCVKCSVPWHAGIGCEEFQKLNEDERGKDDLMVKNLAKEKMWMRCSQCKFYVEKRDGCLHVTCRCGFEFCYGCGEKWNTTHNGCIRV